MVPLFMKSPRRCRTAMAAALVGALIIAGSARAAEEADVRLQEDAALSLRQVVSAALERDPAAAVVEARAAEARTLDGRAGSWIAADPSIALRWQDSGPLGRSGIREYEGGLELPLWKLGQREAAARLARDGRSQADAEALARELRIVGEVRESLWSVAMARVRLKQAEEALAAARTLEAAVERRVAVGDQAPADRIPARDWRLDREARVQDADIVRVHAELAYRLLTGLERLPVRFEEAAAPARGDGLNPWLAPQQAHAERAQSELALARRSRGGSPVLTLGARNELGGPDNGPVTSLGAGLSIPLGVAAASRSAEAAAAVVAAQADSELALSRRRYEYLHHEAEHEFEAARIARDRLRDRAGLAGRELANADKAFAVGEIGLAERLLIETRARAVLGDAAAAELEYGRATARFNQIQGVLP